MNTKNLETWEKERNLEAELLASISHIESGQCQELKTVEVPYPTSVRLLAQSDNLASHAA
jgi:hypothetical protein